MAMADLRVISAPRKINLREACQDAGVELPDTAQSLSPAKQPVLLPYQARWVMDDAQIKICEKSRRTGITWAEASDNVMTAAKPKRRQGANVFYVGSKKEMALEYIAACSLFAKAYNQLAEADVYEQTFWDEGKKEEILSYMIRFPNSGFKIQALSSRPSNLRGLQGDVVIDEAAFHEALNELLKAAMALTMWGNRVRVISTHNGIDNLFNQYIEDARAGRKDYSVHTITLDDAIAEGLYKRICYVNGKEWSLEAQQEWRDKLYKNAPDEASADEEYGCIPKQSGGHYIKRVLIEQAMVADRSIPIIQLQAPKDFELRSEQARDDFIEMWCEVNLLPLLEKLNPLHQHVFGEDFARRGDMTVFLPLEIKPDLMKRTPFMVELSKLTYDAQRQVMFYVLERLPRLRAMAFDATGNGGYLAEAAALKYGVEMVDQVMLNDTWYREWMPKMKAAFEDGTYELPRHQNVLDDFAKVQVKNGIPKIDKGSDRQSDGTKRHGDFAVALAMAERASWMDGAPIEFEALPSKRREQDIDDDEPWHTASGGW
ncbi:hypothetical protein AKK86_02630 [Idiomarina sp. FenBw--71]|nr:hypothetical protein [Idiomarina sp. FeN1]NCU56348.1 hypothetical protein [Idiomarina sp. FenA--70]NCU59367.1 hypothetical protein [Idiomarina sp. FenBw--71]